MGGRWRGGVFWGGGGGGEGVWVGVRVVKGGWCWGGGGWGGGMGGGGGGWRWGGGVRDGYGGEKGGPGELARRYFTEYLRYEVTGRAREGLGRFFEMAGGMGFLRVRRRVEYLEIE